MKTIQEEINDILNESRDPDAERELELYVYNDESVYKKYTAPLEKSLSTLWKKNNYDHKKAIKDWIKVVQAAAKAYSKEFGSDFKFNNKIIKAVASTVGDDWLAELEAGNLHEKKKVDKMKSTEEIKLALDEAMKKAKYEKEKMDKESMKDDKDESDKEDDVKNEMDTYSIQAVKDKVASGDWTVDGEIKKGGKVKVTDKEDGGQTGTIMIKESEEDLNEAKIDKDLLNELKDILADVFDNALTNGSADHLEDEYESNELGKAVDYIFKAINKIK